MLLWQHVVSIIVVKPSLVRPAGLVQSRPGGLIGPVPTKAHWLNRPVLLLDRSCNWPGRLGHWIPVRLVWPSWFYKKIKKKMDHLYDAVLMSHYYQLLFWISEYEWTFLTQITWLYVCVCVCVCVFLSE